VDDGEGADRETVGLTGDYMVNIVDRFREEGGRLLRDALGRQSALQGLDSAINELASVATLTQYHSGDEIIRQDAADNDIAFILSGRVSIVINQRDINSRQAGQHVGEMALIDSSAHRSATVIALEETVLARVSEPNFSAVADRNPQLWRRLAIELGDRLRQRTKGIRRPNEIPVIFIGSSKEALPVARALQAEFSEDNVKVQIWDQDVFQASDTAIESLEAAITQSDFSILVLAPDDYAISREKRQNAPRDNVIFELGLFMGALGRLRTYILSPQDAAIKKPSDLLGLNVVPYSQDWASDNSSIKAASKAIRFRVNSLGPK
jgi:CRP/FNR family transcriptional regulator, cyclic AMP receptor protein